MEQVNARGGFCVRFEEFSKSLIVGGVIVAATQMMPMLQFIAGAFGTDIADRMRLGEEGSRYMIHSEPAGFVATLVTGGILITVSAFLGIILRVITPHVPTS